jgi:hypothetical protein
MISSRLFSHPQAGKLLPTSSTARVISDVSLNSPSPPDADLSLFRWRIFGFVGHLQQPRTLFTELLAYLIVWSTAILSSDCSRVDYSNQSREGAFQDLSVSFGTFLESSKAPSVSHCSIIVRVAFLPCSE